MGHKRVAGSESEDLDDEIDGMKEIGEILKRFERDQGTRMLKFCTARHLGWSWVRFERVQPIYGEQSTGDYA